MAHARKITLTSSVEAETEDNMTCAICHEVYKAPKLLECTHTFCQDCLGGFVGEASKFHCPMCRREIRVPPGGVSAFRSNPYIRSQDLDKARKTFLCREHAKKELELYCLDCDLPVCVLCMMKGHVHHHMKTISEAAADVRDQLQTDRVRLQHAVEDVTKHVAEAKGRLKALQEKKISVEKEIRCRHASLVAAADKLRDEALRSLKDVSGEIEQRLASDCQRIQENLDHLKKLHNTVGKTLTEGVDYERATVAKEMRCGEGKVEAVREKVSCRIGTITRPVLRCGETDDSKVLKKMGEFVGEVVRLERRESMVVGKKSRASVVGRIGSGGEPTILC